MNSQEGQFERNLIRTVALIGLVRFMLALSVNDPEVDGYQDLYLDVAAFIIFALGFGLISKNVGNRWLVALFYLPLIIMMLISFYLFDGLTSSGEINSFALVIIFCLTTKGRWPIIFTSVFLIGVFVVLFLVEPNNLKASTAPEYYTDTFTLLVISLAVIWLIYHAKKGFDTRHEALLETHTKLSSSTEDLTSQHQLLNQQNQRLTQLKEELEEKVFHRTEALKAQKETIQEYMQLTLIELMKPYQKTTEKIKALELEENDELNQLIIDSGKQLESEIKKIKKRLATQ